MFRFALAVTAIELVLTLGASLWVSFSEVADTYLTEDDLRSLRLTYEDHSMKRWSESNVTGYDSRALLLNPEQKLMVRLRTDASSVDLNFLRVREESYRDKPGKGESTVINEPLPGEEGYAVRHRGPTSVRFEVARLRGRELLLVRVSREQPFDSAIGVEMSRCERRARMIQQYLMEKMRWRE